MLDAVVDVDVENLKNHLSQMEVSEDMVARQPKLPPLEHPKLPTILLQLYRRRTVAATATTMLDVVVDLDVDEAVGDSVDEPKLSV